MSIVRKVVKEIEKRKALTAILLMLFMMLFLLYGIQSAGYAELGGDP